MKHIWDLLSKRRSLWVDWIWCNYIRDSSFWSVKSRPSWSWLFRSILNLRPSVRKFFVMQIGSGEDANAWEDLWLPNGALSAQITARRFHAAGFDLHSTVRDVISGCGNEWPVDWTTQAPDLLFQTMPTLITDQRDAIRWRRRDGVFVEFSVKDAWRSMEDEYSVVYWQKYVWFKGCIPKHAFCMWMACHSRLPTQDRIGLWKHEPPDMVCSLCRLGMDSHNHLFFQCPYAVDVWRMVKREFKLFGFPEKWEDIMLYLRTGRGPSRLSQKLAMAATMYFIWAERNRRLFDNSRLVPLQVFKRVRDMVLLRMALKVGGGGNSHAN